MTRAEDLDGDAVAHRYTPALRRSLADLLDNPQRFVARDQREHPRPHEVPAVLLDIAAAHTARFNPQQSLVRADNRPRKLPDLVRQRSRLYCASNHQNPPGIVSSSYRGMSGTGSAFSSGGV